MTRLLAERLVSIGLIIAGGIVYFLTRDWPGRSDAFPDFASIGTMVLALGMLIRSFMARDIERLEGSVKFDFSYRAWKPFYIIIVGILYSIAVIKVGFYTSSFVFYFIVTYMVGLRNHKVIFLTAAILFPVLYAFFTLALDAYLPEGILF
ncbi:MAG: hypothetical protein CL573_01705 [Alphaproteobacteria bacterium]|nr:hypothetical protein [Alphaproteobacteria bacterium]HCP00054.1 hypothetical protein [Rhodospirillaceae bacterium]